MFKVIGSDNGLAPYLSSKDYKCGKTSDLKQNHSAKTKSVGIGQVVL